MVQKSGLRSLARRYISSSFNPSTLFERLMVNLDLYESSVRTTNRQIAATWNDLLAIQPARLRRTVARKANRT
eukprot:766302-Hanusia_phi.AAC.1